MNFGLIKLIIPTTNKKITKEDMKTLELIMWEDLGSITTLFKDNMNDAREIMNVITNFKNNYEQIS
jgi:type I restriction enzyme R subunit